MFVRQPESRELELVERRHMIQSLAWRSNDAPKDIIEAVLSKMLLCC